MASKVAAFDLDRLGRDMTLGLLQILVLATIAKEGPLHGYGLIRSLEIATGGNGWWKEGTLYPLLATLEKQGILASSWGTSGPGARRKSYELTPAGKRTLRDAKGRWGILRDATETLLDNT
jgi:PadR family transcriptional regulator PadR